ncbi:MAG: peptidase U32 family protein [Bacteroidales bacterium]
MQSSRKIELLAPAKNMKCGIEAVKHGADAVYVGGPRFGARAVAGNSIDDIARLVDFAHLYGAKVYVALNTILFENELKEAERQIHALHNIACDAIIVQDMGITRLDLPPIALHASTQCDIRTPDKARFFENLGFKQVVLARELSLLQVESITNEINIPIEVFVHGALCVSYSGNCYISQELAGRSANRGNCAQFCRLPYTLIDKQGSIIERDKHLLSMRDLNQTSNLEKLIDIGVSSFKIEGRLKDVSYVKNIVAHYNQKLNEILQNRSNLLRSSSGSCDYSFIPSPESSFNRGFTNYLLKSKQSARLINPNSPKSIGERLGRISRVEKGFVEIDTEKKLNNGDGLCFVGTSGAFQGTRVDKVEGKHVFVKNVVGMTQGLVVYRNYNHRLEQVLSKESSIRTIRAKILISESKTGFVLKMLDEDGAESVMNVELEKEKARTTQLEQIERNLKRTGGSIYVIDNVSVEYAENWFIPSSLLSDWRRKLIEQHNDTRVERFKPVGCKLDFSKVSIYESYQDYRLNISNSKSEEFYTKIGFETKQKACETSKNRDVSLMFTEYCIKDYLGYCPKKTKKKSAFKEPYCLKCNEVTLRLEFDCKVCEMRVYNN